MKNAFSRLVLPFSFVLFLTLFLSNTIFAQDSIVLVNNEVILAKVEEIDVNDIKYHKADNINGPLYDLPKANIYEIIYMNGTVDVMTPQTQNNPGIQITPVQQAGSNQQNQQGNSSQQNSQGQPNQPDNSNQQNQQYNSGQDNTLAPNTQNQVPLQQDAPVTMQTFYDQLSPYGNWVNNPNYGYVWVPNVGADFTPYGTAGHWAFTDYGWTWVSDFQWGWAAFHYGRWFYDPYMGYVWAPTTQWGPAWVSWRSNEGYYGWAPLGPAGYEYPRDRWVFVNSAYITNQRVYDHYEPSQNVSVIYNNTSVIQNNYVERGGVRYVAGPSRAEVEQVTHTTVTPVRIVGTNSAGQTMHANGMITMYHPAVRTENDAAPSRPAQVTRADQITPPAQRTTVVHPAINNEHSAPYQQQQGNYNRTAPQQPSAPAEQQNHVTQPERTAPAAQQQNNTRQTQQQSKPAQQQQPKPRPAPKPANPKPAQPEKKK